MKIANEFIALHLPPTMYSIKAPYVMDNVTGITLHNTQNRVDAKAEINNMIKNRDEVSFHFACDNENIIQGIPCDRNAWHAGDGESGPGNRNTIAIETCFSGDVVPPTTEYTTSSDRFKAAEQSAIVLIALLLETFDLTVRDVDFHFDYSRKICPMSTIYDHSSLTYDIDDENVQEDQVDEARKAIRDLVSNVQLDNISFVPRPGTVDITVYKTDASGNTDYIYLTADEWIDAKVKGLKIILDGEEYFFASRGDSRITTFKARFNKPNGLEGVYEFYTRDSQRMESYNSPKGYKVLKLLDDIYDLSDLTTPWNKGTLFTYESGVLDIPNHYYNRVFTVESKEGVSETFFKTDRNKFACIESHAGQWYNEEFQSEITTYETPLILFQNITSIYPADDIEMEGYLPFSCFKTDQGTEASKMLEIQIFSITKDDGNYLGDFGFYAEDVRDLCYNNGDGSYTTFEPIYDVRDIVESWALGTTLVFQDFALADGNGGGALFWSVPGSGSYNAVAVSYQSTYEVGGSLSVSQSTSSDVPNASIDTNGEFVKSMDGVLVRDIDIKPYDDLGYVKAQHGVEFYDTPLYT